LIILAGDFIGLTRGSSSSRRSRSRHEPQHADQREARASVVDFMSLGALARGKMSLAPEFQYNGQPVIDTSKVFYVGGSLGGSWATRSWPTIRAS